MENGFQIKFKIDSSGLNNDLALKKKKKKMKKDKKEKIDHFNGKQVNQYNTLKNIAIC